MTRHAPQVDPGHYADRARYDHRRRFISYWNQIDQVRRAAPRSLLEVGVGNGFVSRYLREEDVALHTVDHDARLSPDTVASVLALPFGDAAFDVAACFETLEHLEWGSFVPALEELRRVSRRLVLLSLPDVTPYLRVRLESGFRSLLVDRAVEYPRLRAPRHEFDGQHHWEIGKRDHALARVTLAIESAALTVASTHRDYEDPYHRFFVCRVPPSRR